MIYLELKSEQYNKKYVSKIQFVICIILNGVNKAGSFYYRNY